LRVPAPEGEALKRPPCRAAALSLYAAKVKQFEFCKRANVSHLQNGRKRANVAHFQATINSKCLTMRHLQICHSDKFAGR